MTNIILVIRCNQGLCQDRFFRVTQKVREVIKEKLGFTVTIGVEHDWNMKAAADQMFIHYNTMKYRYKKICELL